MAAVEAQFVYRGGRCSASQINGAIGAFWEEYDRDVETREVVARAD